MIYNFFFEILLKEIANLLFWELWECLINPTKIIASISSKLSHFSACKKSTSPLTSFLRYCKEIANLLFWVIWGWLATHTENDSISFRKPLPLSVGKKSTSSSAFSFTCSKDIIVNLLFSIFWACLAMHIQSGNINSRKTFMFICRQKINFIRHAFLEILQRYGSFSFWVLW